MSENTNPNIKICENTNPNIKNDELPLDQVTNLIDREKTDNLSLEKLVSHANKVTSINNELVSSNAKINEEKEYLQKLANLFMKSRNDEVASNIETHIRPWIKSLEISDEEKALFLKSIEDTLKVDVTKPSALSDFKENPVWSVACAAGAKHGALIAELEQLRAEKVNVAVESANLLEKTNVRNQTLMQTSVGRPEKRRADEISQVQQSDAYETTNCWSTVFDNMSGRGGARNLC
jgi:hypothetical protein